jgi:hypothetical protein
MRKPAGSACADARRPAKNVGYHRRDHAIRAVRQDTSSIRVIPTLITLRREQTRKRPRQPIIARAVVRAAVGGPRPVNRSHPRAGIARARGPAVFHTAMRSQDYRSRPARRDVQCRSLAGVTRNR